MGTRPANPFLDTSWKAIHESTQAPARGQMGASALLGFTNDLPQLPSVLPDGTVLDVDATDAEWQDVDFPARQNVTEGVVFRRFAHVRQSVFVEEDEGKRKRGGNGEEFKSKLKARKDLYRSIDQALKGLAGQNLSRWRSKSEKGTSVTIKPSEQHEGRFSIVYADDANQLIEGLNPEKLYEFIPALVGGLVRGAAAAGGALARGAAAAGGFAARGAAALGRGAMKVGGAALRGAGNLASKGAAAAGRGLSSAASAAGKAASSVGRGIVRTGTKAVNTAAREAGRSFGQTAAMGLMDRDRQERERQLQQQGEGVESGDEDEDIQPPAGKRLLLQKKPKSGTTGKSRRELMREKMQQQDL